MPYPYATPFGKLTAFKNSCHCVPESECLSVYGAVEFGAFLFGMMIGTPILSAGTPQQPAVASWLAAQLRGFANGGAQGTGALAEELAELLDPDGNGKAPAAPNVGAATFLLFGMNPDRGRP